MEPIMAETTTITVRIPNELKEKLDRLGDVTKRSRSFLAAEALAGYADGELAIIEGIERGIADADAGRVVPHDEAMAELRTRVGNVAARSKKRSA
jgi:predicted transcriptional regulator